jgi:excisionase family DNA binding protein
MKLIKNQLKVQPQFLTVPEVAKLLRVKERLIYTWVSQRKIPYRKAGRFTLFDRDEILSWTKADKA